MFKFIFKLIKLAFVAALGTALAAKFLLESNAKPETEEIDLVSIFSGTNLAHRVGVWGVVSSRG